MRVTAKAETEQEAQHLIAAKVTEIQALVGDYQYGKDDDSLASKTVEMLLDNQLTISAAESLTAGLFQSELAEIPGVGMPLLVALLRIRKRLKLSNLVFQKNF